jgi:hypothetical protein
MHPARSYEVLALRRIGMHDSAGTVNPVSPNAFFLIKPFHKRTGKRLNRIFDALHNKCGSLAYARAKRVWYFDGLRHRLPIT